MRVGLVGLAGAGKDTVALMLMEKLRNGHNAQFSIERFASPLKQVSNLIFGDDFDERDVKEVVVPVDPDTVLYHTFHLLIEVLQFDDVQMDRASELYTATIGQYDELSPRLYQQLLGTEIVRAIDPEAWVKRLARRKSNLLCPDVRFANEASIMDKLILIQRHPVPKGELHPSEVFAADLQSLDYPEQYVDYIITNNGTFQDLEIKVSELAKRIL